MAVTLEKPINTKKNSLTNFKFVINFDFKRKKLTPKELIKRCGLDKKYV
ncbi:MAG: hypothetical protein LBC61_02325 [Candidatus Peribacteria bacterium]|jgi:hypothetical protein|nr:hypothetical protein [Candidatus Peribacteria bacterium]